MKADSHTANNQTRSFITCCFSRITSAIPPRIATDARSRRRVMGSPRKTMPPRAAMTGTLSYTVAAVVAFNAGNAVYQMAYPIPEANAPDETAYQIPA